MAVTLHHLVIHIHVASTAAVLFYGFHYFCMFLFLLFIQLMLSFIFWVELLTHVDPSVCCAFFLFFVSVSSFLVNTEPLGGGGGLRGQQTNLNLSKRIEQLLKRKREKYGCSSITPHCSLCSTANGG